MLTRYFVTRFTKKMNKRIDEIHPTAMEQLCHYHWPGNVRELLHVLERAVILCKGSTLMLPADLSGMGISQAEASVNPDTMTLEQIEREHIVKTLEKTAWAIGGPQGPTTILGLHRNTLRSRMERLGIKKTTQRDA